MEHVPAPRRWSPPRPPQLRGAKGTRGGGDGGGRNQRRRRGGGAGAMGAGRRTRRRPPPRVPAAPWRAAERRAQQTVTARARVPARAHPPTWRRRAKLRALGSADEQRALAAATGVWWQRLRRGATRARSPRGRGGGHAGRDGSDPLPAAWRAAARGLAVLPWLRSHASRFLARLPVACRHMRSAFSCEISKRHIRSRIGG